MGSDRRSDQGDDCRFGLWVDLGFPNRANQTDQHRPNVQRRQAVAVANGLLGGFHKIGTTNTSPGPRGGAHMTDDQIKAQFAGMEFGSCLVVIEVATRAVIVIWRGSAHLCGRWVTPRAGGWLEVIEAHEVEPAA